MPLFRKYTISLFIYCAIFIFSEWSCQTDAHTSSRIPPVPNELNKNERQKNVLAALTNLIKRKVDLDVNYFKRSNLFFESEDYQSAFSDINTAIEIKDNVGEYYLLRGKINRELNKLDPAFQDALRAESLQQDTPDLYVLLADIFQEKKQFREAQKYLISSFQMAPYEGDSYYVKSMMQAKMGDTTASIESMSQALGLNPRMLRAYQQLSSIYTKLGENQKALEYNQAAIKRFPNKAELFLDQGRIYQNAFKLDSAVFSFQNAVRIDSSLAIAHYLIGTINLKWKSYPTSLVAFENVLKYRKDFPLINYLIGECYEKLGNDDKAAVYYMQESLLKPDDPIVASAIQRIQNRKLRKYDPAGLFSTKTTESKVLKAPILRTLDTSRIKITTIQPRRTLKIGADSTVKMSIK